MKTFTSKTPSAPVYEDIHRQDAKCAKIEQDKTRSNKVFLGVLGVLAVTFRMFTAKTPGTPVYEDIHRQDAKCAKIEHDSAKIRQGFAWLFLAYLASWRLY